MHRRLFLVSALIFCFAGEALCDGVPKVIQALAGDTVILPCSTTDSGDFPTVEWSKGGLMEHITFLYRDGCEIHEMKNHNFRYRTSLIMNELKNGNISLRISNVQLSDAGEHVCRTIQNKAMKHVAMELSVGAVSEPKLSVVPAPGGGVTLQCEANCWFPKPEITFEDDKGNSISAEDPKTEQDPRGCFNVTRRLNVQTEMNRIICRVHQPEIKQTKFQEIYIPADCFRSCATPIIIAGVEAAVLFLALVAFLLRCICKKFGICVGFQKSSVPWRSSGQSATYKNVDYDPQRTKAGNVENATNELLMKIDELKLKPDEKRELIRRLTEELHNLKSRQSTDEHQNGPPITANNPSELTSDVSESIPPPPSPFPKKSNSPKPVASTRSNPPKSGDLSRSKGSKHDLSMQNAAPDLKKESQQSSSPAVPLLVDTGATTPSSAFTSDKSSFGRSMSFSGSWPRPNSVRSQRRHTTSSWSNSFSPLENLPEDDD